MVGEDPAGSPESDEDVPGIYLGLSIVRVCGTLRSLEMFWNWKYPQALIVSIDAGIGRKDYFVDFDSKKERRLAEYRLGLFMDKPVCIECQRRGPLRIYAFDGKRRSWKERIL